MGFDPLGCTKGKTVEELGLYREAELAHGRVAMMASLGFLVQEAFHPIFPWVDGPAARQLDRCSRRKTVWLPGASYSLPSSSRRSSVRALGGSSQRWRCARCVRATCRATLDLTLSASSPRTRRASARCRRKSSTMADWR